MGTPGRRLPTTLALLVALAAAPATAFDLHDVRYFRETGYRWCRGCDLRGAWLQLSLSGTQLEGANLSFAQLQGAYLFGANLRYALLSSAQLQGADLSHADLWAARLLSAQLQGANLANAQLRGANLSEANLERAHLFRARLEGANLRSAQLQGAYLFGAGLENANLSRVQLRNANLSRALLRGARLSGAELRGANLSRADLQDAHLSSIAPGLPYYLPPAQLRNADLGWAQLQRANLSEAQLQGANLSHADLQDADLSRAQLRGTRLSRTQLERTRLEDADLSEADLRNAELRFASLRATNLEDAKLSGADLSEATYEAATAPARGHLTGLRGLTTVRFEPGQGSGLAQLRAQLAEAGLRDAEREATYALERQTTRHKLEAWQEQPWSNLGVGLEGLFRRVFFEWPVSYGLYPGRALLILLGFILVFSVPYMVALVNPLTRHAGIWRVWAEDRVLKLRGQDEPERLEDDWYGDPWWRALYCIPLRALQFSLLSAFHIGFREINVGSWIARIQAQEYTLRATGWVRVVAGIQSLLSIYLIAIWALTYFGRPFQ